MPVCPRGHGTAAGGYCDACGVPIGDVTSSPYGTLAASVPAAVTGSGEVVRCPEAGCGTPRAGRYCEACGHDFEQGATGSGVGWRAVVVADRHYYERVAAVMSSSAAVAFPREAPQRSFVLAGSWLLIGRRSRSGRVAADIDLADPPVDPGISHVHACLVAQPGGAWAVVDAGSTNGTTVNDDARPIEPGADVPLGAGESIHLGAWTTITLYHGT